MPGSKKDAEKNKKIKLSRQSLLPGSPNREYVTEH